MTTIDWLAMCAVAWCPIAGYLLTAELTSWRARRRRNRRPGYITTLIELEAARRSERTR